MKGLLSFTIATLSWVAVVANAGCGLRLDATTKGRKTHRSISARYPYPAATPKVCSHCPIASFKQPNEPLHQVKGAVELLRNRVGDVVNKIRNKFKQRNPNQEILQKLQADLNNHNRAHLKRPQEDVVEDELPAGQDTQSILGGGGGRASSSPSSSPSTSPFDDLGPALFVLGRAQSFETSTGGLVSIQTAEERRNPARRMLNYGNWFVNGIAFTIKVVAVILFQVLGAAMIVNEHQTTGSISKTLRTYAGLLAGLAFLPPVIVALRESLPSHSRNPFLRGISRIFEIALDTVVVAALSLLASLMVTAVISLPSYSTLLSFQLGEEYIKGALASGLVFFFLYVFSRNFEPLAAKWFI